MLKLCGAKNIFQNTSELIKCQTKNHDSNYKHTKMYIFIILKC